MNRDPHAKASRLIEQDRVEGISSTDRGWLQRHLEDCTECNRSAAELDKAIRSLRAVSIPLPPALTGRTQMRVYLRAMEIEERRSRTWLLWAACVFSWVLGIATAPYIWRGFEWLGQEAGLPRLVWKVAFALWWAVPALLAAGAALIERSDGVRFRTR